MAKGFPRGAVVEFVSEAMKDNGIGFSLGTRYVVGGQYHDSHPDLVCVETDDKGKANGWLADFFKISGGPW